MRIYKNFDEIDYNKDTVLTVGTFDGVHKGHRMIIDNLLKNAKTMNCRAVLLTFEPHPQIVLQKENLKPIKLLTTIEERLELFETFGIDDVLIIPFSLEFAKTPPDVFVKKYLIKKIGMKKILIGFDHMFGKDREGNEGLLNKMSKEFDFEIEKVGPLLKEGIKVSSSKIREDIAEHYIKEVNEMLGYDFFIKGKVVLGDGRGKTIGFPTANIDVPEHKQLPANGIYLIKASFNNRRLLGLANIGTRPTFTDDKEVVLEVYLFDFNEDIYGEVLKIEFLDFLRQEEKFDSADSLLFQIEKDIVKAKEMLHSQQSPVNSR